MHSFLVCDIRSKICLRSAKEMVMDKGTFRPYLTGKKEKCVLSICSREKKTISALKSSQRGM